VYYIAVYDFEEKKVGKALKLFRQYLNWVQNSVFEGELTDSQFEELKKKAHKLIDPDVDSVIFYSVSDEKWLHRNVMGKEKNSISNFI
jgi:CRISPR-associated protein Cas2